jgi:BirA family biotin operon repressor/biotin-[acetyl-CoA-carboxylase] ligase
VSTAAPRVPATLGSPRLHFVAVDSTNLRARALAESGAPHGTLVTAAAQSAGRGRQGRAWSAPAGTSLLMSLVLRDPPPLLSLRAGVAVADCVAAVRGEARGEPAAGCVTVKWPNDVLADGRKLAGILVEGRPQDGWAVLGIGLNVAVQLSRLPADVRERAATLGLAPTAVEPVLEALLAVLERWLDAPVTAVLDAVRARDALLGREVRWAGGSGVGAGIDVDGRLLVQTADERVALEAGEVHLDAGAASGLAGEP